MGIGVGRSGAASELVVAADLIRRGYDVYHAVSPHAPFDLVAAAGETMLRIEVRTSREKADGTLQPYIKETDRCDVYAFVVGYRIDYVDAEEARRVVGQRLRPSERRPYLPRDL